MSTLEQIRAGLHRTWDTVTEGWRELRELAGDALTRFHPKTPRGEQDSAEDRIAHRASRWGLLAVEVADTDDHVEVSLEAPGLKPEDFDIEVLDDVLVVRGEKRVAREDVRGHYHVMERAYGRFERAVRLPAPVAEEGAEADYKHGVLTVRLPKSAQRRRRRITVNG